jgi:predicted transcriptional regulator
VTVRSALEALTSVVPPATNDELSERNGQTLFEICARLATKHHLASSRQAISQHLELLEQAGLIESERKGRCKFHEINTKPLERIVDR